MNLFKKTGQTLTEYLILTALVAVGSIAVVQLLSRNIRTKLTVISEGIRGKKQSRLVGDAPETKHYETLNMKDFAEGASYDE